jgi:hypothetical protein
MQVTIKVPRLRNIAGRSVMNTHSSPIAAVQVIPVPVFRSEHADVGPAVSVKICRYRDITVLAEVEADKALRRAVVIPVTFRRTENGKVALAVPVKISPRAN